MYMSLILFYNVCTLTCIYTLCVMFTSLSLSLFSALINRPDQWDDRDPITPCVMFTCIYTLHVSIRVCVIHAFLPIICPFPSSHFYYMCCVPNLIIKQFASSSVHAGCSSTAMPALIHVPYVYSLVHAWCRYTFVYLCSKVHKTSPMCRVGLRTKCVCVYV